MSQPISTSLLFFFPSHVTRPIPPSSPPNKFYHHSCPNVCPPSFTPYFFLNVSHRASTYVGQSPFFLIYPPITFYAPKRTLLWHSEIPGWGLQYPLPVRIYPVSAPLTREGCEYLHPLMTPNGPRGSQWPDVTQTPFTEHF